MTLQSGIALGMTAFDVHAEGEPGRVIVSGMPDIPGSTVFDQMKWLETNRDDIRIQMLTEPRGYPALCCNAIVPPITPGAHAGFIVMEQTEYPPMSGSNTICVVTVLLETGIVPMAEPYTDLLLDAPAGPISVRAHCKDGRVEGVTFTNVPAFAMKLDVEIDVPSFGKTRVDISWGGMIYVIADAEELGVELSLENSHEVMRIAEMIRQATFDQCPVSHPLNNQIVGPTISQISAPPISAGVDRRNAVVLSAGELSWDRPSTWRGVFDRSPCGTGTCAKMAVLYARGELQKGDRFVHEGPLGTTFVGEVVEETTVGDIPAIIPSITGRGWITGKIEYFDDPTDPFKDGYRLGDIWPA